MPAWLNRALTKRIVNKPKQNSDNPQETVLMRIGDKVALPKDVDVYIFDTSDKAKTFAVGIEYPEELDAAVESGLAVKGNAKNLIESIPPGAFVWLASNM